MWVHNFLLFAILIIAFQKLSQKQ